MQNRNPYAAPRTNVSTRAADSDEEYGEIKVFSSRGRLGRVRYIAYTIGITFVFGILFGIAAAAAGPAAALAVTVAGYALLLLITVMLTIQRAHDFNASGWLAVLALVPLVNLMFLVIPGTDGENRYGKRPPPNSAGAIALACLLPVIVIVGLIAAVAIPAYQDYTQRAAETPAELR
jgi:uncharacterized membrane protein YhaH (DUF805 family)